MANSLHHPVAVTAMAAANAAAAAAIGSSTAASAPASSLLLAEQANNLRLMSVYDRISLYLNGAARFETSDAMRLCYSLAKIIDCSLTLNDIPGIAHRLPSLVKKVYEWRKNTALQSAIMMLLISIKNACQRGWFRPVDSEELLCLVDELCSKYCTELCSNTHVSHAFDTISKILPRFYPRLMLCSLIASFEAKPGYDVLMSDFHFPKSHQPEQRIVLIVVKTENLETSSCIASPPQVSFLVNGKGVEKRNNVSLDCGPQLPTDISKMLKYGINVLQTIGYFDGTYLIAIAYMSKMTNFTPALKDYVQPVVASHDSDAEIIEGPSRILLSCPISFKRIRTPVKGHLCKHHQCFDYENFLEMNSRKPNWRCPHCNQPVCMMDLRTDQNMVKILEEARLDVTEVVIQADGSWNVVSEQGRCTDQSQSMDCETNISKISVSDPVDLTTEEDDDKYDITHTLRQEVSLDGYASQSCNNIFETEDRKPFIDAECIPVPQFLPNVQVPVYHHQQIGNSTVQPTFMPSTGSPLNMLGSLVPSDFVPTLPDLPLINGRPMPRHVDRTPAAAAVQALPVLQQMHSASRRLNLHLLDTSLASSNLSPRQYQAVNTSTTTPADNFSGGIGNMNYMQQATTRSADTPPPPPPPSSHRRGGSDIDAYRASLQPSPFSRNSIQTPPGFRTNVLLQSTASLPSAVPQNSNNFGNHHPRNPLPPQLMRTVPNTAPNSVPGRVLGADRWRSLTGGMASALSRSDGLLPELPADPNWRPTGRMRGSLTGSDYSAVISNYMAPLNQSGTASRPSSSSTSDQVSALIANNLTMAHGAVNHHTNLSQDNLGTQ